MVLSVSLENIIKMKSWLVLGFHGIENDFMDIPYDDFKQFLELLHSKEDLLWIAPMSNIIQYSILKQNVELKQINNNTIRVKINKKNISFDYTNQPLTFITRVKNNNFYKITIDNKKIFRKVQKDENGYYLIYNLTPKSNNFKINIEPVIIPEKNSMTEIKSYTFSKDDSFTDWDLIEGKYLISNDMLHLKEGMSKVVYKKDLKNFLIKGKLKINSDEEKSKSFSYVGFFIRAKEVLRGENNGIYFTLDCHSSISEYRTNEVILWEQKRSHIESSWYWPDMLVMASPCPLGVDKWHIFELLVKDNYISLKIDDEIYFIFDDLPVYQGFLGLNNRGTSVDFDNLTIYEIN